jgi:hypothetical protein
MRLNPLAERTCFSQVHNSFFGRNFARRGGAVAVRAAGNLTVELSTFHLNKVGNL